MLRDTVLTAHCTSVDSVMENSTTTGGLLGHKFLSCSFQVLVLLSYDDICQARRRHIQLVAEWDKASQRECLRVCKNERDWEREEKKRKKVSFEGKRESKTLFLLQHFMTKKKLFSCVTRLSMIGILPNLQFWKRHPRCAKSNCTRKPRSWPLHHCWQERWTWWPPGRPTCLCPHTSCPLRALGTYSYPSRGPSSPHRCYEHPLSRRGWPQYTLSISLHGTQCTECTCKVSKFPRFWDKMGWCTGQPLLTNESSGLSDLVQQKCVHLDTF